MTPNLTNKTQDYYINQKASSYATKISKKNVD